MVIYWDLVVIEGWFDGDLWFNGDLMVNNGMFIGFLLRLVVLNELLYIIHCL